MIALVEVPATPYAGCLLELEPAHGTWEYERKDTDRDNQRRCHRHHLHIVARDEVVCLISQKAVHGMKMVLVDL